MDRRETYHFVVVCPNAAAVFLIGEFNDWSTTATPMRQTEKDVWQIDLEMPAGERRFSYFVIDERYRTGRAPFGNTFLLPGTWAKVMRSRASDGGQIGNGPAEHFPGDASVPTVTGTAAKAVYRSDILN